MLCSDGKVPSFVLAGHVSPLEGASPLNRLMETKGERCARTAAMTERDVPTQDHDRVTIRCPRSINAMSDYLRGKRLRRYRWLGKLSQRVRWAAPHGKVNASLIFPWIGFQRASNSYES